MPTLTLVAERTSIQAYELTTSAVSIGRGEDMSRRAHLKWEGAGFEVRNLSSWHRMRVNGEIVAQAPLEGGDVIEARGLRLTFLDEIA